MIGASFDVIVLGLGAMGSAAAFHLAQAGQKVLGIDRHVPPHTLGSSHGRTRIIREAYFEHPAYVPFVQRAYELWKELEDQTRRSLFAQTGGLMIGPRDGIVFGGAMRSALAHGLPHEVLGSAEIQRRFPAFHPAQGMEAVWEPRAGILFPEACIEAHLELARRQGAALHLEETVRSWGPDGRGIQVVTDKGRYSAAQLVCCAGAWMGELLRDLHLPLRVERQVLFWFEPCRNAGNFTQNRCPIFLWEFELGRFFYGFPNLGDGFKVAGHHAGASADPDALDRDVSEAETAEMRAVLRETLPDADGALRSTAVCMYTNTPDTHFILDRHPSFPQVIIASPCSGHGFKFSSAIGEVLAQLVSQCSVRVDLSLFRLSRFAGLHGAAGPSARPD